MARRKKKKTKTDLSNSVRSIVKKEKPIIGIDIGSSSIKIISMKKNHKLDKWIIETLPIGMMNQGRIEAKEPLAEIIKKALKIYKIKTKHCALYLSSNELIVRELTFPQMEDIHIRENIAHEISSMLPQDHEEYYMDYKVLEYIPGQAEEEEGQLRVLAAAVPENLLRDYVDTLGLAGLKVKYIDVLPNIGGKLCKLIYKRESIIRPKNICMIDFGAKKTETVIYNDGNYSLHKTLNYGGEYLTSLIARETAMDEMDAEDYKFRTNFFEGDPDDPTAKAVHEYFDYLIRDFDRTMEFFSNRNGEPVDKIYIMGGGSLLTGLPTYLEQEFDIKVQPAGDIFNDFKKVGAVGRHISIFSQAIGVTYREEWNHER